MDGRMGGLPSIPLTTLSDTQDNSCHRNDKVTLMATYRLSVKDKGRTVLPAALQRECGFAPGSELLARPIGNGQFIVESAEAVLERIWSQLPDHPQSSGVDSLHEWRRDTDEERNAHLTSTAPAPTDESRQRGADLLATLDL